ncbi:MAG: type II toxin-antitoxin system VapC family toxin [Mailhella sp.]|nr:type II toxin-antitoxin system VapC family toxin [Mailhella sp.]
MKILLDTHVLLWAAASPEKISEKGRRLIEDAANELFFSAASLWEISIKNSLGRPDFHVNASLLRRSLLDNGYRELPVSGVHALALEALPLIHKDPFDRMLIAQASSEGYLLMTADSRLAGYPAPLFLI